MLCASSAPCGRGSKTQKFSLPFFFSSAGGVGGADKKWKGNFWFCFAGSIYTSYNNLEYNTTEYYDIDIMTKAIFSKDHKYTVEQLKKARLEASLDQAEVAKLLDKTQSHVSKIESGQRRLDVVQIKEFSRIYKKDLSFFIK